MKTEVEIAKRLQKLRKRYRQKYVQDRVGRHYPNCVHNYKHAPKPLLYSRFDSKHGGEDFSERMSTPARKSLNVLQDDGSVHICTYGSDRNDEWNGEVCDDLDKRAPSCPWFKPARTEEEVGAEFDGLMSDVEFVFENYRDMATLQWVLDIRSPDEAPEPPPTLWERLLGWLRPKPAPQLPPPSDEEPVTEPLPEVPKDLWNADSQDP